MSQKTLLSNVEKLLDQVLRARFEGTSHAKFARANGYVDGYMKALLDAGIVDQKELLKTVGNQRRGFVQSSETSSSLKAQTAA